MSDNHCGRDTEDRCTAVFLVVETVDVRVVDAAGRGYLIEALGLLEEDIAGKAVGDHHISAVSGEQRVRLDIADEAVFLGLRHQAPGLAGDYMSLAAFSTDIEQGHPRLPDSENRTGIDAAQPGKMAVLFRSALSIETHIQQQNPLARQPRKLHGDTGAVNSVHQAQPGTAGRHHSPGIARAGESIYLPRSQHIKAADQGRLRLSGHRHGRMVRESNPVRTMHYYKITGAATHTVTGSGNSLLISEEIHLESASAPFERLQCSGDLIARGEIAAHGVKADSQLPHADLLYVLLYHQTSAIVAALRAYAVIQYCGSAVGASGKCGESQFVMSSAFVPALL